jgi:hypothetical protein
VSKAATEPNQVRPDLEAASASRQFLRGLSTPSAPALVMCLLVFLGLHGAGILALNEEALAGPGLAGRIASNPDNDSYLWTTSRAYAAHFARLDTQVSFDLVIVGGSGHSEVIRRDGQLEGGLEAELGCEVEVLHLQGAGQDLYESATLVDLVGGLKGVVLLGVSPLRFLTMTPKARLEHHEGGRRQPIAGAFEDEERERFGLEPLSLTGVHYVDHFNFYAPRLPNLFRSLLWLGPATESPFYSRGIPWPEEAIAGAAAGFMKTLGRSAGGKTSLSDSARDMIRANLDLVSRLSTRLARRGESARFALLEAPLDPDFIENSLGAEWYVDYKNCVERLASERDWPYWSLSAEARLTHKDFYNVNHCYGLSARRRFTAALVSQLRGLVSRQGDDK